MKIKSDLDCNECSNKLYECDLSIGIKNQVPWWKHGLASWRNHAPYKLRYIEQQGPGQLYDRNNALPIVMIKDPVYWISSMCRNRYEVNFMPKLSKLCPMFVPTTTASNKRKQKNIHNNNVTIIPPLGKINNFKLEYKSLIDLWNQYYNEWLTNTSYPKLIIRYEDLLYHPKDVITKVCACGGGIMRNDDFQLVEKSAKVRGSSYSSNIMDCTCNDQSTLMLTLHKFPIVIAQNIFKNTGMGVTGNRNNKERSGIVNAMIMYGTKDIRDSILNDIDKEYVNYHLMKDVMDIFNYPPP